MIPVSSVDTVRNREYFSLDGTWLMAEGGDEKLRLKDVWTDAVEAVVPGSVHTALLMNRIIPILISGKMTRLPSNRVTRHGGLVKIYIE